jgi:Flp pilus assembly protein TadG
VSTRRQDGIATVALPMLLWIATLAAIAAIDLGAYLTAAARAQALADAVALAAVSADQDRSHGAVPIREADRVATAGGGQLVTCACTPGTGRAHVSVSVPVPGLVLPTLGASRVTAEAGAALVEPAW